MLIKLQSERFIADLKYNSTDNFLKKNVYQHFGLDKCFVHPDLHEKLMKLEKTLISQNLKLILYDCYRPIEVQREFWKHIPDERFIADPQKGSNHNRGVAIDCGLANEEGQPLEFPTMFDDFTEKSSHLYQCSVGESVPCRNRNLLATLMKNVGLEWFETEWWHYQLPNAANYPIVDIKDVVKK